MMRIFQTLPIGSVGSEYFNDEIGRRYAAMAGIVYDLEEVRRCVARISDMLAQHGEHDAIGLTALTWHAVILYARCFDPGAEGRLGTLGQRALRLLTRDEKELHDGLLAIRDQRFAHAGIEARHRCVVALYDEPNRSTLTVGVEIERPTGMNDPRQAELMAAATLKLLRFAMAERDEANQSVSQRLAGPEVQPVIAGRIRRTHTHATPEMQALAILAGLIDR